MKLFILIIFFLTTTFQGLAQQLMSNLVGLVIKGEDENVINTNIQSTAIFSLKNGSGDFTGVISMFPILPNRNMEDTIVQQRKPLVLELQGQFPINNIDFLTIGDNGKMYTMAVNCKMNDSTKNVPLNFDLLIRQNASDGVNSGLMPVYNPKIRFQLVLNPYDFALDLFPYSINRSILVNVSDAVINRVN